MNLPDTNETSITARLENARRKQWHQQGEALLTVENARSFLNATGLVMFSPRPQIAAPAPSFVEAVLGEQNATPSLAQMAQPRELLAQLVAEGLAVPLNLLGIGSVIGQAGDAPDFIVSAQVFSYVFTLRGDKAWKQPPQATGAAKFSNLAIAVSEALTRRGPLSAYDLATELGKEVTEGAVLRSLGELWMHLRVLPLPQLDRKTTLWEPTGTRLIKQMKAGANAGLPTALSTLISLYLGQAIVASEEEIESFLSPLAARSRVRDVLHALLAARELDTVVIEGKTVLHVAGEAPAFLSEETLVAPAVEEGAALAGEFAASEEREAGPAAIAAEKPGVVEPAGHGSRIARFVPGRRPSTRELGKAKPAQFASRPFGEKRPFASHDGNAKPPYRESKGARPVRERTEVKRAEGSAGEGGSRFEKKRFSPRSDEAKPKFVRPKRLDGKPERERRPFVKREGDTRTPRKPFERSGAPRKPFDRASDSRPPRKAFDRSGDGPTTRKPFDRSSDRRAPRKPFDRGGDRSAVRKPFERSTGSRPPRKPFDRGGDRPDARKSFGSAGRFAPRGESSSRGDREARGFKSKPFSKREASGSGERARPSGFGSKRPFVRSGDGSTPFRGKERSEGARPERGGFAGKKFGAGRSSGAKSGGYSGGFGEKKFGARSGGAKFGAKKPFGRPAGERRSTPSRPSGDKEA